MKLSGIKKVRVAVALLIFISAALLYLDINGNIKPDYFRKILYIQFIPSLFKFISIAALSASGFIIILIFTFLFGRVYCSFICPLGILMDIISRFSVRSRRSKRFRYSKPNSFIRYSILAITLISLSGGSLFAIHLLDPFTNFGRIFTCIFRPLAIACNYFSSLSLEKLNIYFIKPYEFTGFVVFPLLFSLLFFILIIGFAWNKGRLYCNTICPLGALLGLISKFSPLKIGFIEDRCTKCRLCVKSCKASCINLKYSTIDFSRCVACFNCLNVCPEDAINYKLTLPALHKNSLTDTNQQSRRTFLTLVGFIPHIIQFKTSGVPDIKVFKYNMTRVIKNYPVTPPGSQGISRFTSHCTSCLLCVSSCPSQVLQPSISEYGLKGLFIPRLDNRFGFCNYNCNRCSQVCPSGAILPVPIEDKKLTQLGKVKFIRDNCIVVLQGTECGACAEHCPTKAVFMVKEGKVMVPKIDDSVCIGCGACEFACPAKPFKSIYVEGNLKHITAKKPQQDKRIQIKELEDFPF